MGVLDARVDAEKVGFPVVGEDVKEASNVIDYNLREEQTKDTSAVDNANNQTTTGMATVIPGINAPKLIAKTSIIGDIGGGGGGGGTSTMVLSTSVRAQTGGSMTTFDRVDSSSLSGEVTIDEGRIYSSTGGTYLLSFVVNANNANVSQFDFSCRNFGDYTYVVYTTQSGQTGSFMGITKLNANDYVRCAFLPYGNSCNPTAQITIVKI